MEPRQHGQVDENAIYLDITPAQAQHLLDTQPNNRSLRLEWAQSIARDMSLGRYDGRLSNVLLDTDGLLIDGQHRMKAIVIYGQPVKMRVIIGLDRLVVEKVDGGRSRTNADRLKWRGVTNYTQVAAALKLLVSYKRKSAKVVLSSQEHLTLHDRHSLIEESVAETKRAQKIMVTTPLSVVHHLGVNLAKQQTRTEEFLATIMDGMLPDGSRRYGVDDPAHRCREWILAYVGEAHRKHSQPSTFVLLKGLVYAYNAYCVGRTSKKFLSPIDRDMDDMIGVDADLI